VEDTDVMLMHPFQIPPIR